MLGNGEQLRMLAMTARQLLDRSAKDVRARVWWNIAYESVRLHYYNFLPSPGRRRRREVVIPSSLTSVFRS